MHLFWKDYQTKLLTKLKDLGTGLVLAGDGRHDSMGHCAKFGAYTILCCTAIPSLIHFALVQVHVCTTWIAKIIFLSKAKKISYMKVYILRCTANFKGLWTHAIIVKCLRSQNLFWYSPFSEESSWQQPCNGVYWFSAVYEFPCWMWHCNNHLYLRPSHPDCSLLQDSPQTHHTVLWPMAFKEKWE